MSEPLGDGLRERMEDARAVMRDRADGPGVPLRIVAGEGMSYLAEALYEALDAAAEEGDS